MLLSLVKILWVILFGEIYCEEILIEVVSVEKSWVDLLDEHLHGEEEFRELVCCYELLDICENTLGEELWS